MRTGAAGPLSVAHGETACCVWGRGRGSCRVPLRRARASASRRVRADPRAYAAPARGGPAEDVHRTQTARDGRGGRRAESACIFPTAPEESGTNTRRDGLHRAKRLFRAGRAPPPRRLRPATGVATAETAGTGAD